MGNFVRVKPYRTPPSSNIQSSPTQKCCGVVFFFFFCIIFFYNIIFFFNWKIRYFACWILSLITASTEMWCPKIWIRCWDWLLINGHLLYGSTPRVSNSTCKVHKIIFDWAMILIELLYITCPIFQPVSIRSSNLFL